MFSGGQAQRVMIARALMHEPEVLFLDEPTTGLDPAARLFVWDRLRELRDRGVTLFLTTHDMDEAAALADRVGIMDHGKLLALDTPEALMRSLPGAATLELTTRPRDARGRRAGRGRARVALRASSASSGCRASPTATDRRGRRAARAALRDRRAPLLVAPAAAVLAAHGLDPDRRQARHADARGRVHPPDREGAAMTRSPSRVAPASSGAFLAVLRRDVYVTWSEFPVFLAQVILQPFFLLFVFGKVLGSLGYTQTATPTCCSPGCSR